MLPRLHRAPELGPYLDYQILCGSMPPATCIYLPLYMAMAPSLGCYMRCQAPEDRSLSHQDLPLATSAPPNPLAPSPEVSP